MEYFTADLHLGHENIIKYCNRPFKNAREMDDTIIYNLLSILNKNDTLYIIGDISFKTLNYKILYEKLFLENQIIIYFLKGNHDCVPNWTKDFFTFYDILDITIQNQPITLCHYPMVSWNKSHFNSWMLYGHVHNNNIPLKGKMMNVGVDVNNFKPVSFEQVKEYMSKQPDNYNFIPEDKRRK